MKKICTLALCLAAIGCGGAPPAAPKAATPPMGSGPTAAHAPAADAKAEGDKKPEAAAEGEKKPEAAAEEEKKPDAPAEEKKEAPAEEKKE